MEAAAAGSPASSEGTPQAAASVHAEDLQVAPAPKVRRLVERPLMAASKPTLQRRGCRCRFQDVIQVLWCLQRPGRSAP